VGAEGGVEALVDFPSFMVNKEMKELLGAHGFGRGEDRPPPLYDKSRYTKPVPLVASSEEDYLVTVRQLFRDAAKNLPYYIKAQTKRKDVECYSDKYLFNESQPLQPDWSRLPAELNTAAKRKRKVRPTKLPSPVKQAVTQQIASQLEELEKNEKVDEDEEQGVEGEKKKPEGDDDDEEIVDEDEYNEMEQEEENDYAKNYYESDDSHGDDEDDNLDADGYY
jgi:hypothetical protein